MSAQGRAASDAIRLQKYLSQAGVASRREAEGLITAGRVTVNGTVSSELGVRVRPGVDEVRLDGALVEVAEVTWLVLNKPPGVLCTRRDPHGGKTVYDVLPSWARGLRYVGRLDRDTSGLLLMTNEGDLGAALAHPSGRIEREYVARVKGAIRAKALKALKAGIELEDGFARPKRVRRLSVDEDSSTLALVLTEGRKREVRRLLRAVRHPVVTLERVRFGPFELGDLPVGRYRPARERELEEARSLVNRRRRRDGQGRRPKRRRPRASPE